MRYQRTIHQTVTCSGIGLHTGEPVTLRLRPAAEDHGIVFIRTDLGPTVSIRASAKQVISSKLSTTVGCDGVSVQTIEHILAACAGLRVDNLVIEVDRPEIPILDGSAAPFVRLLQRAGIKGQSRLQPYLRLIRPIQMGRPGSGLALLPTPFPKITYAIDFSDRVVQSQKYQYHCTEDEFIREIAPARTFGFLKDVEQMRAAGFIKGGSLDNAVVIGEQGVLNPEGLRFPDECVRHKVLDLIGDLALAGAPIVAHIVASCSGHEMNVDLLHHLQSQSDAWIMVTPDEHPSFAVDARRRGFSPVPATLPL